VKWLLRIAVVLAIAAGIGWFYRIELMLEAIGVAAKLRYPVGPHREIEWSTGPAQPASPPAERPPNIVLIVADDLGWNDITFGGGGVAGGSVPTPHIDSIAADGVQFTNGYSSSGTCAPSRAALMSGRYPTRFGFEFTPTPPAMLPIVARMAKEAAEKTGRRKPITYFDQPGRQSLPFEEMGVPASEITLAETLQSAGYHTTHIGKWHLGRANGMAPHDQGFDESLLMASGLYLREDDPDVVNSKQDFDPIDRFLWKGLQFAASFNGSEYFEPGGYLTDYYTDEAVRVIDANANRPLFLYLAHWAPHTPLQATKADYDALSHIEDHTLRVYAAMIRALDRGVGRVLEALRANGLEENTLVIFTSDNGGAHYIGLPEINRPYRGWKISHFEGGIHVPYFMRWPARIAAGSRYEEPVHHFDVYATAAAAAGAPLPSDRKMDGVDLVPFAGGETRGAPHDRLFWRQGHYQVVLSDGWKLQRTARPDKTWLFHLRDDPTERRNVAADHPAKVEELLALLAAHNAEQSEPAWPALIEAPTSIDKTLRDPPSPDDEYIYWPN
jgi:uncharacterized sulfatase